MESSIAQQPVFSIGVTTYKRKVLLKKCINAILSQTFKDYEILVGNDSPSEQLTYRDLGVQDQRIRIFNNRENLGEAENMRMLLQAAKGKYFTWLADDDQYMSTFLESVVVTLTEHAVPVVYTNVLSGRLYTSGAEVISTGKLFTGGDFLSKYLAGDIAAQGNYGVFEKAYIESVGWEKLGDGFDGSSAWGPYSDVRLLILAGGLPKVAYIDTPKIFMRVHSGSMSIVSDDLNAYISGQVDLFEVAWPIVRKLGNSKDIEQNVLNLFGIFIDHFFIVFSRRPYSYLNALQVSTCYGLLLFRLLSRHVGGPKKLRKSIVWIYFFRHLVRLGRKMRARTLNFMTRVRQKVLVA